jgi:hypothetical protein
MRGEPGERENGESPFARLWRALVGPKGDHCVMPRELVGVTVRLGRDRKSCESSIEAAGGYVVVIESTLAVQGVLLVSSYLAELSGRTAGSRARGLRPC